MSAPQFELLNRIVVRPLQERGAEVFLFGSRATGKDHPHSDVDLLYRIPKAVKLPGGYLSEIKEAIEESAFPFAVDLVHEEDLATSYRTNVLATMVAI